MKLTPREVQVLEGLDTEGMVRLVSELVRIPSVGGAETPAQRRVADWMREAGMEVDVWDLDFQELKRHPEFSAEVEREEGLGVVGWTGGGGSGPSLILNGHVDVVPPGDLDQWSFSPWEGRVEAGRVWGRGALDMKGGLAAGLFAVKAIIDAGVRLQGRVIVQSVVGEEDGGTGTLAAIQRGYGGDAAVIMEPTDHSICLAQAGCLNFRISVEGKAAHGCVRDHGVSALEKFFVLHQELLELEARRNRDSTDSLFREYGLPFPLSVGRIQGGDWASSVPDWVRAEGRYGVAPEEDVEAAKAAFQETLDRASASDSWLRDHPPKLEWWGGRFLPARVSPDVPLVSELQGSLRDLGRGEAPLRGVTFGSDMRLLVREAHTPAVLFGPGDIREAHAANESIAIDDLELTARTLALTALRFCG